MKRGKVIIISAPSGTGKSTIIAEVMRRGNVRMEFSVSATSRPPRQGEVDGVHYHFLSESEFRELIDAGEFIEYEEVYAGRFYGTLRREVEQNIDCGRNVVLDIDVKGGVNVKRIFGEDAVSIFIEPPSVEALRQRLTDRGTDSAEVIAERVAKAEFELGYAPQYDHVVVNDNLTEAVGKVESIIRRFTA